MKNDVQYILKILLNILIIGIIVFLVAKLFIFLLPVIIVLIIAYYIYRIFNEAKGKVNKTSNKTKKIKNEIEDAEIVEEKFDK